MFIPDSRVVIFYVKNKDLKATRFLSRFYVKFANRHMKRPSYPQWSQKNCHVAFEYLFIDLRFDEIFFKVHIF